MTVIVGYSKDKYNYLGADTLVTMGDLIVPTSSPKILLCNKTVLGAAGNNRGGQLAMDAISDWEEDNVFDMDDTMPDYRISAYSQAMRERFEKNSYDPVPEDNTVEVLIGYDGRWYHLFQDGGWYEIRYKFFAIGSGSLVALGALEVYDEMQLSNVVQWPEQYPEQAIQLAIGASAKYITSVGPMYLLVNNEEKEGIEWKSWKRTNSEQ